MQIVNPIILLIGDKTMKILFQGLIGTFDLKAWREFTINLEEPKQVFPNFWDKLWVLIANSVIKKAMMPKHFMHNQIPLSLDY